jgi:insulysin
VVRYRGTPQTTAALDDRWLTFLLLAQSDAAAVKKLSKADMIEFYTTYIAPSSPVRAKLAVYLVAQGKSAEVNDTTNGETEIEAEAAVKNESKLIMIDNVRDFKARLEASAGARPVKELSDFEESDAKL